MSTNTSPTAPVDLDTQELHSMGYSQELRWGMGAFSNFAVSFSIISILTGGITTYYLGMDTGGPRAITRGWIVVGIFVLCVGASMGEICSAYPTALGCTTGRNTFRAGPWHLGRWSALIGWVAVVWVAVITILFFAPAFWPWTTAIDFDWAGPLFVAVMAVVTLWWFLSARKWFIGPRVQGTPEELAEIERDLALGQIDDRFL